MKATIIGEDYIIILEKEKQELPSLRKGVQLEAVLFGDGGKSLDKKVIVRTIADTDNFDGIDIEYVPKHKGWSNVREIRVRLNQAALDRIESLGRFGTRYDGSNMIDIYAR